MCMSPTARTIKLLKEMGYATDIVEHWNPFSKTRHDLFNFADILALSPYKLIAIQCTSGSNHSARRKKILASPLAKMWLQAGNEIALWSWSKQKVKRNSKVYRWTVRAEEIQSEDYE